MSLAAQFRWASLPAFLIVLATTTLGQAATTKDASALLVLGQMAKVTGWQTLTVPADATGSGTLTDETGQSSSYSAIAKGKAAVRIQTSKNLLISSGVVAATTVMATNQSTAIPTQSLRSSLRPWIFPFLTDLGRWDDTSTCVRDGGPDTVAGESAEKLLFGCAADQAAPFVVWLSVSSHFPLQLQYYARAASNPNATSLKTVTYADFHFVNGIAVPFRVQQTTSTGQSGTVQFAGVTLNSGVSDTQFAVPEVQQ